MRKSKATMTMRWKREKGYKQYRERYNFLREQGVEVGKARIMKYWSCERINKYLKDECGVLNAIED